jgi:hypothetical protein
MSWLACPVNFWRILAGTSALAIAELNVCRSEWSDSRETSRSKLSIFLARHAVVDASALHQPFE